MRGYVTVDELLGLMNERLHRVDDGDYVDCRCRAPVYWLGDPDDTGCNWSDSLHFSCSGRSSDGLAEVMGPIVAWAREHYNLLGRDGTIEDLMFESNGHSFECRSRSEGVTSTADVGRPTDADNTGWWVSIDGEAWRRAFDASMDDQDPREIRSRIVQWHKSLGGD